MVGDIEGGRCGERLDLGWDSGYVGGIRTEDWS